MEKQNDIDQIKSILGSHLDLDRLVIWRDLILSALVGWGSFLYTIHNPNIFSFFIAAYFLYKGAMLIHEVVHLSKKIKGYRLAYNILFGWPLSYPAYIYDTHLFHHGKRTYATKKDPEYKYIPNFSNLLFLRAFFTALLLPLFQLFRFGILPLLIPFAPRKLKLLVLKKASTLVFDPKYERPIKSEQKEIAQMLKNDFASAAYKLLFFYLLITGLLPIITVLITYLLISLSSFVNMSRALLSHLYTNSSNDFLSWEDHLLDTATVSSGFLTNLMFVNGLNFHAIHHMSPELPYHNLKHAHKDILSKTTKNHLYNKTIFNSPLEVLKKSLSPVWRKERLSFKNESHSSQSQTNL